MTLAATLKPVADQTTASIDIDAAPVTYKLAVDVNLPMIGMFRRKAEKTIIDGALKGLKRRVES